MSCIGICFFLHHNFLQRFFNTGYGFIKTLQGRPGYYFFHAARFTTITGAARFIQEIMPPFSSDSMMTFPDFSIDHESAADTGAHNDPKNHSCMGCRFLYSAPGCFCKGKTIGVISKDNGQLQSFFKVLFYRLVIQYGCIGIF